MKLYKFFLIFFFLFIASYNFVFAEINLSNNKFFLGEQIKLKIEDVNAVLCLEVFNITNNTGGSSLPPSQVYNYQDYIEDFEEILIPLNKIGLYQINCLWNTKHQELFFEIIGPEIEFNYQNNIEMNSQINSKLIIINKQNIDLKQIKLKIISDALEFKDKTFNFDIVSHDKKEILLTGIAKESGAIILSFDLGEYGSFSKKYDLYVLQEAKTLCKIENLLSKVKVGEEFNFKLIISNTGDFDLENITINILLNDVLDFNKQNIFLSTLKKHSQESFIIHGIPKENRNTVIKILCSQENLILCETFRSISVYGSKLPLKLSLIEKEYSDSVLFLDININCQKGKEINIGCFYNSNIMQIMNYPTKSFIIFPDQNNYNLELKFRIKNIQLSEGSDAIGVRATYLEESSITDYLILKND